MSVNFIVPFFVCLWVVCMFIGRLGESIVLSCVCGDGEMSAAKLFSFFFVSGKKKKAKTGGGRERGERENEREKVGD